MLGNVILTREDLSKQRQTHRDLETDPYRILCEIVIQGVLQFAQFLVLFGLSLFLRFSQPCLRILLILQGLKETPTKSQCRLFVAGASTQPAVPRPGPASGPTPVKAATCFMVYKGKTGGASTKTPYQLIPGHALWCTKGPGLVPWWCFSINLWVFLSKGRKDQVMAPEMRAMGRH